MWILILSIIIALISYYIGYYSIKTIIKDRDRKEEEEYQFKLDSLREEQKRIEEQLKHSYDEFEKLEKEINFKKEYLFNFSDEQIKQIEETSKKYEKTLKEKIDSDSVLYKKEKFSAVEEEYNILKAETDGLKKQLENDYINAKINCETDLASLQAKIKEYQKTLIAIAEDFQRKEEAKNKIDFYKICLKDEDIEDINNLKNIVPHLNNKDILNRLIYEAYYKNPMTDMFNRVAKNKPCGIYKITNTLNGMIYIGKSVEIAPRRWSEHIKSSLNIGTISHTKIHDAINKDGINNFTFEVLEECDKDKLAEREKYWISFYNSDVYGYNIRKG